MRRTLFPVWSCREHAWLTGLAGGSGPTLSPSATLMSEDKVAELDTFPTSA